MWREASFSWNSLVCGASSIAGNFYGYGNMIGHRQRSLYDIWGPWCAKFDWVFEGTKRSVEHVASRTLSFWEQYVWASGQCLVVRAGLGRKELGVVAEAEISTVEVECGWSIWGKQEGYCCCSSKLGGNYSGGCQ